MKLATTILSLAFLAVPGVTAADGPNGLRGLVADLRDLVAQGDGDGSDFARRLTMEMEKGMEMSAWSDPLCADFVQSMKTEVEKIEGDDEEDVAEFACSSIERENVIEFFKYLEGLDYSTLADCQAEIYTEMFGDRSDIADMIITLGSPETCLVEVHEEYQLMDQVRKLVGSKTSRELPVCVAALIIAGVSASAAVAATSYQIGSGTYEQDKAAGCYDDGTRCLAGTTCANCCSQYSEWWEGKVGDHCGVEPCWGGGTVCGTGTTCNSCCRGANCPWYQFGVCNCK